MLTDTRVHRGAEGGGRFPSLSQGEREDRAKRVHRVKETVKVARTNDRETQALTARLLELSARRKRKVAE